MNIIKKNINLFMPFCISFAVMLMAFAHEGLFPFGDNQIMVIDSWHQYYPFLQELHNKLTHGESILYSWNTGLGSNFLAIIAYYAMSPLNLISVIFPKEYLREFMMLITITKISLAGSFFALYLKETFKKDDFTIVIFGLMYSFCGFAMGYYWNIMWLDSMALFPLVILGINRILEDKGFLLYCITLGVAIISNFYIGYFVCEFAGLYFLVQYFSKHHEGDFKLFGRKVLQMAVYSLLAIALAAVIILPVAAALSLTYKSASLSFKDFEVYSAFIDIINNMLLGMPPSVKSGLPNVYSGLFALLLLILYFFNNGINIKQKLGKLAFLLVIILSFNFNYLDYIFHGFKFPNEVPFRYAFVFSFMVISIAYEAYINLKNTELKSIVKLIAGALIYLLLCEKIYGNELNNLVLYLNIVFVAAYGAVLVLNKKNKLKLNIFENSIYVLVIAELIITALTSTNTVGSSGREGYPTQNVEVQQAISKLYQEDKSFYRIEMTKWYSVNDPVLYGYRGYSQFASTANSKISTFGQRVGLAAAPEANRYVYSASTPIVNGLFDLKYFIDKKSELTLPSAAFEKIDKIGTMTIYKNKYYLPLGYMTDSTISLWNIDHRRPFEAQEDFLKKAASLEENAFKDIPFSTESLNNIRRSSTDKIRYYYENINSATTGSADYEYIVPETKQIYFYMFANRTYDVNIKVAEKSNKYDIRRGQVIDLGTLEAGTKVSISFEVFADEDGFYDLQLVEFNEEAYKKAYQRLADEPFNVTYYSDRKLEGEVTALQEGTLYMAIPYEKGWKAVVDGKKTEILPLKDAMITIPLEKGTHTIKLSYTPAGFTTGFSISVLAVLILGYLQLKQRKFHTSKENIVKQVKAEASK